MIHTAPALPLKQVAIALATCFASSVFALPSTPTVVNGTANFSQNGKALTVTNSNGAIINWGAFSIQSGESTYFSQPNATSSVLNRVVGRDPTSIYGTLGSNGRVYLVNPQGIFVGPGGRVDVHRFVASTLTLTDQDFLGGRLSFRRDPEVQAGAVRNEGLITTPSGGQVYLVGAEVTNRGTIAAPEGEIGLLAGNAVQIIDSGTPGVRVELSATDERVQNFGVVAASGGRIGLAAALTENAGLISANSVQSEGGRVWLRATRQVNLRAEAIVSAQGSHGGAIVIHGDDKAELAGSVDAQGGLGVGGTVEVLGQQVALVDQAKVDASGDQGGGRVLIGGDLRGENPAIPNAQSTYLGTATLVKADAISNGDGGTVVLWSERATRALGRISARGGDTGGNGGFVETSSRGYLDVRHAPDVMSPGGDGGAWLLDPHNLTVISGAGTLDNQDTLPPYDFTASADSSTLNVAVVNAALNAGTNVTINTGNDTLSGESGTLTIAAPILKSAGATSDLTLLSAGDTFINSTIQATTGILNLYTGTGIAGGAQKVEVKANISLNGGIFDATGGSARISFPLTTPVTVSTTALSADEISFAANTNVTLDAAAVNTRRFLMPSGSVQVNGGISMSSGVGTPGQLSVGGGTLTLSSGLTTSTPEFNLSLSGGTINAGGSVLLHQTTGNASITTNIQANGLTATVSAGNLDFFGGLNLGAGGLAATANNTGLFNTSYTVDGPLTVSTNLKLGTNASLALGAGTLYIGGNVSLDPNAGGGLNLSSTTAGTRRSLQIGGVLQISDGDVSGVGTVTFTDLDLSGISFAALTQANISTHNVALNKSNIWAGSFSVTSGSITGNGGSIDVGNTFTHSGGTIDFGRSTGSYVDISDDAATLTLSRPLTAETIKISTPFGRIQDPTGAAVLSANKVELSSCSSCSSVMTGGIGSGASPIRLSDVSELSISVGGGLLTAADVYVKHNSASTTIALEGLKNDSPGGKIDVESSSTINFSDYCPDGCETNVTTNGGTVRIAVTGAGQTLAVAGNAAIQHIETENISATASANIDLSAPGGIAAPNMPLRIGSLQSASVTANAGSAGVSLQYVSGDLYLSQFNASGNNVHLDSLSGDVLVNTNRTVLPGKGLYLSAFGDVLQAGGGLITGGGDLYAKGNSIDFSSGGNAVANLTAEGYSISFANSYSGVMKLGKLGVVAGWQDINGLDGAPVTISNVNGSVATDTGKSIIGGNLSLSAAGAITANTAGLSGTFSASTGAISVVNSGDLQLKASSAGGALSVTATGGDLLITDTAPPTISATGTVLLKGATVTISNATVQSSAAGNAVRVEADTSFSATSATINPGSGRWLIYSADPTSTTRGSLESTMNFKQYNATFASAPMGSGNGFLYAVAPSIASTASGFVTKTYDGLSTGPGGGITVSTSSNLIDSDVYGGGSASGVVFTSKNVGATLAAVNFAASTITYGAGIPVYGYSETFTSTGVSGSITPAVISAISGITANNRAYDGTNVASLNTGGLSFAGMVAGDSLTLGSASALFNDKTVGIAKPVSVTGITLGGTDSGNYTLAAGASAASSVADISPLALSISGSLAANKTYDGTTTATVITPGTLSGQVVGDLVNVAPLSATFANKNVGTGKTVTIGLTLFGADSGNYTLPATATATANITPKTITVASATAANKVYDGSTSATVTGVNFSGVIAGDNLAMTGATGLFANKNVGVGKAVTVTLGALSGTDAGNYLLSGTGGVSATADITAKSLTLTGFTAANKTYDGTAAATITGGNLTGVVAGDAVSFLGATGSFNDKNAGLAKPVSVSGGGLSGVDAANYVLAAGGASGTTADILPKDISVGAYTVANKTYDGNQSATITASTLNGALASDDVRIAGASASFLDKNVGSAKPVSITGGGLAGIDAANYQITNGTNGSATADITAKTLLVGGYLASDKVYDGSIAATILGATLEGVIPGDNVAIAGAVGNFQDKNVGSNKVVQVSGGSLSGTDAGNYLLASGSSLSATASITPRPITLSSFSADNKTYDGTTSATILRLGTASGTIATDDVAVTGGLANFSDKAVGTGKTVTLTGITLSGADALNYSLSATTPTATADITARALSLDSFSAANKVYDGTSLATVQLGTPNGAVLGDNVTFTFGSANFSDKNVGDGKTVSLSGLNLAGSDASNYTLSPANLTASANITPRPVSLGPVIAANKVYDGTVTATLSNIALSDAIIGDDVAISGISGAFLTKDVGTGKSVSLTGGTLSGVDARNYTLLATPRPNVTADITPRQVTLDGTHALDRPYDGSTVAVLDNLGTLRNLVVGDQVAPLGGAGSFGDKDVGQAKPVSVNGIELAGQDAGNYRLVQPTGLTASITRLAEVRWTGSDSGNRSWADPANWQGRAIPDKDNVARVVIPDDRTVNYDLQTSTKLDDILSTGTVNFAGTGPLLVTNTVDTKGFRFDSGSIELGSLIVRNDYQQAANTSFKVVGDVEIHQLSGPLNMAINAASANLDSAGSITAVFNESARRELILTKAIARSGDLRITGYGGINTRLTSSAPAGNVYLTAKSPLIIGTGGISAAGDIQLLADGSTSADQLTIDGAINSDRGNISLTGSSVAENASVTSGGGDIAILANGGNITTKDGVVNQSFGGNISFDAPNGDIQISSVNAGSGSVTLRSGGSITPVGSGTNIVANNLAVNAGGNLRLTTSVRNPPVIIVAGTREVTDSLVEQPTHANSGDVDPIRVLPSSNESQEGAENPLEQVVGLLSGEGPGSRTGNNSANEPRPGTFGYEEETGTGRTPTSSDRESEGGASDDERRNRRPGRCRA